MAIGGVNSLWWVTLQRSRVWTVVSEEKTSLNCGFAFLQIILYQLFFSQNYLVSSWCVLFFALSLHPGSIFLLHPQPGRTKHFLVIDLKSKIDFKLEKKNNLDTPPWINLQKSGSSRQPLRSETKMFKCILPHKLSKLDKQAAFEEW